MSYLINFDNFTEGFSTENLAPEELGNERKLTYEYVPGGVVLKEVPFTIK